MKKTSEEIMKEIEEEEKRNLPYNDSLGELQIQKQERLECYKKVLDKFETIYNLRQGSPQLQFILEQIILELKQEIKTLEGGKNVK